MFSLWRRGGFGAVLGFFDFLFFRTHSKVYPFVGGSYVRVICFPIPALNICSLSVEQVHVGHGIVVIGSKLESLG